MRRQPRRLLQRRRGRRPPVRLPEMVERRQHRVVDSLSEWLREHAGWLLVLDNADEAEPATRSCRSTATAIWSSRRGSRARRVAGPGVRDRALGHVRATPACRWSVFESEDAANGASERIRANAPAGVTVESRCARSSRTPKRTSLEHESPPPRSGDPGSCSDGPAGFAAHQPAAHLSSRRPAKRAAGRPAAFKAPPQPAGSAPVNDRRRPFLVLRVVPLNERGGPPHSHGGPPRFSGERAGGTVTRWSP